MVERKTGKNGNSRKRGDGRKNILNYIDNRILSSEYKRQYAKIKPSSNSREDELSL